MEQKRRINATGTMMASRSSVVIADSGAGADVVVEALVGNGFTVNVPLPLPPPLGSPDIRI